MTTYYDGDLLPFDYARCTGVRDAQTCEHCRRRDLGDGHYQWCIEPPMNIETGECDWRIVRSEQSELWSDDDAE